MIDRKDIVARLMARRRAQPDRALPASDGFAEGSVSRAQAVQRLQLGFAGVVTMFLLVGLASVIERRADEADAIAVPEAAATVEPSGPAAGNDPLVAAGVVPDLPDEPAPTPSQSPAVMPETGTTPAPPQ